MQRTVLIVDDNRVNRIVLKNTLCREYRVAEACNGQEALIRMREIGDGLSAVLLDVVMPVMDGYETLRRIREDEALSRIPVIMVTGNEDEESRVKALSLGANDFVVKPYNPEIIRHCLLNNITLYETSSILSAIRRDKITGLYNREAFFEQAAAMIGEKEPGSYILSCFDVDHFKLINDRFGTAEGDRILREIGRVVREDMETIHGIGCRISADNFAVLLPAAHEDFSITRIVRENRMAFTDKQPIVFSVGRYVISDLTLPVSAVYDRAYIAKQSIKGRYNQHIAYFDDTMLDKLVRDQQTIADMDAAISARQFEVWFQPQFNHSTGALVGAEALARWRHPVRGMISPADFIPVFEQNGFIYELDKYIWEESCRCLSKWAAEGRESLPVSVNLSRYDVFRPDLMDVLTGLIQKYGLTVPQLRLEITESAFATSGTQIVSVVEQLVERGFTVEIDDFGSGYSSLNTLKSVPAQVVKLDMHFLDDDDGSGRGGNILESIVRMTKWLGVSVIAEGVEEKAQADYLASIGCNYVQGYLYARPMPEAEFEAFSAGALREGKLSSLETAVNLDNNSFWNPKSMDTLIFNSYVGAACIFEYYRHNIELLRVNDKFTAILGAGAMPTAEILRLDWISCLSPDSLQAVRDVLRTSAETGEEYTREYLFRNIPNCPPEICLRSTMRVIATAGERMLVYCTSENITSQLQAERRERVTAKQMERMIDDMPGGFVKLSVEDGGLIRPVYINEGYCKIVGMTREELLRDYARDFLAGIHADDIACVRVAISQMLADSRARSLRFRQKHGGGGYVWLSVVGRASRDASGGLFLNVYLSDATEQVREEEMQKKLLDNLPCGAGIYELAGGQMRLVYQNGSFWKLVGLDQAAFLDPAPMSAIHPEDIPLVMRDLEEAIRQGRDVACDIRLRHLTLGYRQVRLSGRVIRERGDVFSIYATFAPIGAGEEEGRVSR